MSITAPVTGTSSTGSPNMPNITNLAQMARVRMMQKAWKYYKGDFSQALPVRRGGVNDNVTLNYCRNIVDKGVAFLFGKEPQFSQDADDATDLTEQEIWLDEVWKANKKMTLLSKVGIQGGVTGHVFIKILPGTPYPRIVLLDTQNVTVQTDPGDVETVL
ncbi:MAG TPA: phage portal protein, partial [Gemmatimonadaceae bacterium]